MPHDTPAPDETSQNGTSQDGTSKNVAPDERALVICGLGASAGGLEAFEAFFAGLPEIDGVAFVVILHLAPDEESRLADILQGDLPLPVTQVTEAVTIERGHVYVIPPGKNLLVEGERLVLEPIEDERVRRRPIDHFFRTLAGAYGERTVGVVLSGTGANGTVGVRALKEAGGLILAQDPDEARFDEMPRSAIASGVVDAVGPAGSLAAEVVAYAHRLWSVHLPDTPRALPEDGARALQSVLGQLRARTGHDFASYKRSTVLRRLDRRLHVTGTASLVDYLEVLRGDAAEAEALLDDLLISVTNFFRDTEAFAVFERAVPRLFEGKKTGDEVRVWVAGCATGEEAYSVAMLLLEHAATRPDPPRVQVFATDLSEAAVQTARSGVYPESIEADVSEARLRRFFAHQSGRYRVAEALRETVLFARHSLLADPPFSRLDAVTCRNLLIYFQRDLQQKAIALFHYALCPGGLLFLGTSESADGEPGLFATLDTRARVYRRHDVATPLPALPHVPHVLTAPPVDAEPPRARAAEREASEAVRVHQALRDQTAPPSVLVSEAGDVVDVAGGAAAFLAVPNGAPTRQLSRLLRPELRATVQSVLFQAWRGDRPPEAGSAEAGLAEGGPAEGGSVEAGFAVAVPVDLDLNGVTRSVSVRAKSAPTGMLAQVVFDVLPLAPRGAREPAGGSADAEALRLTQETLRQSQEQLQVAGEEFETSREELRAQNEELQSVNEELRSTAEELETSKEEAQSMAEELRTVNDELKVRVDEAGRATSDLENLVASTEIATLFLDRALRIQRFTPPVRDLFHVLASDVGRPIADLSPRFGEARLVEDAEAVLARLVPQEREVRTDDGRWYLVHVRPYRAAEDRIGGVVVTFVDITRRKADEEALRASAERATYRATLADALRTLSDPVDVQRAAAEVLGEHLGARRAHYAVFEPDGEHFVIEREYSVGVASFAGRHVAERFGATLIEALRAGETVVAADEAGADGTTEEERAALAAAEIRAFVAVPLVKGGRLAAVLAVHHDRPRPWTAEDVALVRETAERTWAAVSRARAETALRASDALFDAALSTISDFVYTFDRDGRLLFVNQPLLDLWGLALEDAVGKTFHELDYPAALADRLQRQIQEVFETGQGLTDETPYTGVDGAEGVYEYIFRPLRAGDGTVASVVGSTRDVSARRRAELALAADARRATFRATLADRLRLVSDPVEVQAEAAHALAEHLGASRVHYAEMEAGGETAVVGRDVARGVPDGSGRYDLAGYPALLDAARAGQTLVVADIPADERLGADEKAQFAALPVAAIVVVPLVKRGRLVALFAVHHDVAHVWADAEVALIEETAERTWAAVERARAEADLRASEERLHLALDASAIGTHVYDVATDRHTLDARALEISGLGADASFAGWADQVHDDDRDRVATAAARALDPDGDGLFDEEYRLRHAGGEVRWVYVRSQTAFEDSMSEDSASEDDEGAGPSADRRPVRVVGTVQDVTARKQTEQALVESESRLRQVAEAVPDVLFRTTAGGTVDFVNSRFETLTGRAPETALGTQMWPGLVHEDDRERTEAAWATAHARGERFEVRHRLLTNDGACWVITRARPFVGPDGTVAAWFGTFTDVDALTRAEAEIRGLAATLERRVAERTREVGRLSARLSNAEHEERRRLAHVLHDDLQQQLAGLSIVITLLGRSEGDDAAELRARAAEITQDAAQLTRSLAAELSPQSLQSDDLAETLRWLADQKRSQLQMEVTVEADGPVPVPDPDARALVYQALRELLFNVVKHAGVREATVRARRDGADVVVEVEDGGTGFDPGTVAGGGFGLFSVRERLELAGGRLDLVSHPGDGTTVTLTLPVGTEAGAEVGTE